jgi:hypothetical protein
MGANSLSGMLAMSASIVEIQFVVAAAADSDKKDVTPTLRDVVVVANDEDGFWVYVPARARNGRRWWRYGPVKEKAEQAGVPTNNNVTDDSSSSFSKSFMMAMDVW